MQTAKFYATSFLETFHDHYGEENINVGEMTEEQAYEFVSDHIESMIAINGTGDLWSIERDAIKDLQINISE